MIDVQQVRDLAVVMAEHGLTEIRFRQGDAYLTLRRGPLGEPVILSQPGSHLMSAPPAAPQAAAPVAAQPAAEDDGLVAIKSPMVGTFYSAPDPESPPFVQVGSQVTPSTAVCIIEAMKVFNEIKAEVSGTIERILVQDEQAVEFGQPLMLVRPR